MLFRVGLAVLVAIVLVGGAVWIRTDSGKRFSNSLVGVDGGTVVRSDQRFDPLRPDLSGEGAENLTKTDIISRELLSDYMNLAMMEEDSSRNLSQLLDNYISSVPELTDAPQVESADIKVVADSKAAFVAYDEKAYQIDQERTSAISRTYGAGDVSNEEAHNVAGEIADAYRTAANKMLLIPTPESLVVAHWKLINNYLSTAHALSSVAALNEDSIGALAGMVSVQESLATERKIVNEIVAILTKNGI
jgi:hypothetical protein